MQSLTTISRRQDTTPGSTSARQWCVLRPLHNLQRLRVLKAGPGSTTKAVRCALAMTWTTRQGGMTASWKGRHSTNKYKMAMFFLQFKNLKNIGVWEIRQGRGGNLPKRQVFATQLPIPRYARKKGINTGIITLASLGFTSIKSEPKTARVVY